MLKQGNFKQSLESREKKSLALKGRKLNKNHRMKIGVGNTQNFEFEKLGEVKLSYIAGIIDGEGSITMRKSHNRYLVRVKIGNTDYPLMDWLALKLKTHIRIIHKNYPRSKTFYHIQFTNNKATSLIKAIYKYLIVKKERADLALNFHKNKFESYETQLGFKKRMLLLNHRGQKGE